jgi:hypothetical protein
MVSQLPVSGGKYEVWAVANRLDKNIRTSNNKLFLLSDVFFIGLILVVIDCLIDFCFGNFTIQR